MHKVHSWVITGIFFTDAVRTGTVVIIPVRYLLLRILGVSIEGVTSSVGKRRVSDTEVVAKLCT